MGKEGVAASYRSHGLHFTLASKVIGKAADTNIRTNRSLHVSEFGLVWHLAISKDRAATAIGFRLSIYRLHVAVLTEINYRNGNVHAQKAQECILWLFFDN